MNKATLLTLPCLIATLATPAVCGAEEFLLYTPKPAGAERLPAGPDEGVLVRSITIKRGDTLSGLSKMYLGKGTWYPELLVFNRIKNPDLIYTGRTLRVPVPPEKGVEAAKEAGEERPAKPVKAKHGKRGAKKQAAPAKKAQPEKAAQPEQTAPATKAPEAVPEVTQPKTAAKMKAQPAVKVQPKTQAKQGRTKAATKKPVEPAEKQVTRTAPEELESYRKAKQAYLTGEYQKAMELFSDFLQKYPNSTSSADAALYRADSMMHLSDQ
ncbi:peptidoglycan-binding protein LysM [Geomonas silvestris]|uniref:Peptidoglycan-binding protein LysM n=1 Tax=Geomonas silvestris TaxID=2740184 RepID=A0A6V8MMX1_9BACT|nr:LysM peptidoglycan-binding domain-containing protein [Geomonas silvestris]GFO61350.1 peptidoglycan-binding protein LysM [Geomonas silvestris]